MGGVDSVLNDFNDPVAPGLDAENLAWRIRFANGASSAGAPCAQHDGSGSVDNAKIVRTLDVDVTFDSIDSGQPSWATTITIHRSHLEPGLASLTTDSPHRRELAHQTSLSGRIAFALDRFAASAKFVYAERFGLPSSTRLLCAHVMKLRRRRPTTN